MNIWPLAVAAIVISSVVALRGFGLALPVSKVSTRKARQVIKLLGTLHE